MKGGDSRTFERSAAERYKAGMSDKGQDEKLRNLMREGGGLVFADGTVLSGTVGMKSEDGSYLFRFTGTDSYVRLAPRDGRFVYEPKSGVILENQWSGWIDKPAWGTELVSVESREDMDRRVMAENKKRLMAIIGATTEEEYAAALTGQK